MIRHFALETADQVPAVQVETYKTAMRGVVSPVAVITTADGEKRSGLTATAVCSATTEPPSVLVCIDREAGILRLIDGAGCFAVNFLSDAQSDLARAFASRGLTDASRPWSDEWTTLLSGAPVLKDAASVFDCRVVNSIPCGRHQLLLGRVVAVSSKDHSTLLYRDGFFRRVAQE